MAIENTVTSDILSKFVECKECFQLPPIWCAFILHRGSYMSVHVLLNLLNKLGKRDQM